MLRRVLLLGSVGLLALAPLTAVVEARSAAAQVDAATRVPGPAVASGDNWSVVPTAEGYRITLDLGKEVPLRAASPLLVVDGKPVGVAKQSADRRSVSLVSQDPRVARAKTVTLTWSSDPADAQAAGKARKQPRSSTDAYWLNALRGPVAGTDPGAPGKYQVETAEYDLGDEAVYLPGLKQRAEVRARVWSARGAPGARPLVVFLHGRHEFCYGEYPEEEPDRFWPCPPGMKPLPSYRGYDAPARALASHGYQVVSISANSINANDDAVLDGGAVARGELVLHHLGLWKRWSTVGGGPFGRKFVGRVDLGNIGLMGHSRGGEGVARAAVLNAERGGRYGIRAVLPLAPTDFSRFTVPGVAMSVLLPYCDGDVSDLQGQKFYDDTRYAVHGDQAVRSTVLVMGANHNYFNTEWTPGQAVAPAGDDWWGDDTDEPCGASSKARLSPKEQQAVGTAYVAGFFRLQLGGEKKLLPLFDGSNTRAASAGRAVVRVVAQAPVTQRRDLARFDQPLPPGTVSGRATAQVCAGVENREPARALAPARTCATSESSSRFPHWVSAYLADGTPTTAVTKLTWTDRSGVVRIKLAPGQRDVRRFSALSFRAAPDPAGAARTDLSVRVVDGRGRAVAVPVSALGDALVHLPGSADDGLAKGLLRTVRLPVTALRGLDLRDVRTVELRTDRVASGSVFISDLSFASAGLGRSAPVRLPQLSVSSVKVLEGNSGVRNADFWVTMSRPSLTPVTAYVGTYSEGDDDVVGDLSRKLVFPPGRTRLKVSVPVRSNVRDGYDLDFGLVLSVPRQAVVGDAMGEGLVVDDDPTPTLSVGDAVAVEGAKVIRFPVRLSAVSDKFVGFHGVLRDGTAVLGKDYTGQDPEEPRDVYAYLEHHTTQTWLEVDVLNDKAKEPEERFTVVLDKPEGADPAGPATVTGTIRDDD